MATPKSLFKVATEKYTDISSTLKETRRTFLQELALAQAPATAADLNKAYTDKQVKDNPAQPQQPQFSNPQAANTTSNPGGSETPKPPPANPAAPAPGQPAAPAPGAAPAFDLTNPNLQITDLPDGRKLYIDPQNPTQGFIQTKEDAAKSGVVSAQLESAVHVYTTEDIMSALSTLSTGAVSEVASTDHDMEGDEATTVKPAGDTLVDEEDDSSTDGTSEMPSSGDSSEVSEEDEPATADQSDEVSASGSETGPEKVDGGNESSWSGLGGKQSSSVEGSEEETDESEGLATKGAGEAEPATVDGNSPAPEIGEGEQAPCGEGEACEGEKPEEVEGNASGKDSAFWVPNDDLLGLKDIVGDVSKDTSGVNAQETIGKDAVGNLVKKPTTPAHSVPNMRQYVKTNAAPGMPMIPPGGQPVDISDLDSVMGMDAKSDKALNISLNFNF